MFTLYETPHHQLHTQTKYTPHYPSPLSSSPLRSSPSPLKERCANLLTPPSHHNSHSHCTASSPFMTGQQETREGRDDVNVEVVDDWDMQSSPTKKRSLQTPIFTPQVSAHPQEQAHNLNGGTNPRVKSNFSKRVTRSNPLLERSGRIEEGRETRRKLFLKKVREERDDKVWERRNGKGGEDELMRVLWSGERAREIERLRLEGRVVGEGEEDEIEISEMGLVDEVLRIEREEMEALIAEREMESELPVLRSNGWMDSVENENGFEAGKQQGHVRGNEMDSVYGSDDDEYDSIFQDVIEEELRMSQSQAQQETNYFATEAVDMDQDMMDLS